jgi:hypothetical protein
MKPSRKLGLRSEPASDGALIPIGVRVGPQLKAKLDRAARETGRSLGAESVARLASSFPSDIHIEGLHEMLGDDAPIVMLFAAVLGAAKAHAEFVRGLVGDPNPPGRERWLEDPQLYAIVAQHLNRMIADLRPPGEPAELRSEDGFDLAPIASKGGVSSVLHSLVYRKGSSEWSRNPQAEILVELLDPALIRRMAEAHGTTPPVHTGETE